MRSAILSFLVLMTGALAAGDARACEDFRSQPRMVDALPTPNDEERPTLTLAEVTSVVRARPADLENCGHNCSVGPFFSVRLSATDDHTPPGKMGFIVVRLDGGLEGTWAQHQALGANYDGTHQSLYLGFRDEDAGRGPIDTTFGIIPVDLNGNEGAPMEIRVTDPGTGGCGTVPALTPALLALVGMRHRRRRIA